MINYLSFVITGQCNSKCIMCNCWKNQNGYTPKQLILENVLKDREVMENIETIEFYGGEPLLRKDLLEIIFESLNYLKNLNKIVIITNGFLHKRLEKICSETLEKIRKDKSNHSLEVVVSLDGIGVVHDKIRQTPLAFKKVMTSVKKLKAIQKNFENFNFYFNTTVCNLNIHDIENLSSFADLIDVKIHFSIISAQEVAISTNMYEIKQKELLPPKEKLLGLFEKLLKRSLETKTPIDIIQNYYDKIEYYKGNPKLTECSYQTNSILIDWDGKCYLCPATKDGYLCDITKSKISTCKKIIDDVKRKIEPICLQCNVSCSVYSSIVNSKIDDYKLTKLFYGITPISLEIAIKNNGKVTLFDNRSYSCNVPPEVTTVNPHEIKDHDFDIVIAFIQGNRNEVLSYLTKELLIDPDKIYFYDL